MNDENDDQLRNHGARPASAGRAQRSGDGPWPTVTARHCCACAGSERASAGACLADPDLDIPEGQVTALPGDNGAGKSTLIKTIPGICKLTSGELLENGKPSIWTALKDATALGIATVYQARRCATTWTSCRT